MRKIATQRRCQICGKLKRFKDGSRYCSDACKQEARIRACMKRNGFDRETAIEWLEDLEDPTSLYRKEPEGWHCHDCGKPSSQYRCPACKRKFLKAHGYGALEEEFRQQEALEEAE